MSMKQSKVVKKRKKSALPSKATMKRNIQAVFDSFSWDFFEQEKNWYWNCHKWCQQLADEKGVDLMCVVGVFAAMSSQNSFRMNKIFCRLFFDGVKKHTASNHNKACSISHLYGVDTYEMKKERICKILNGSKTQNFFINILEPFNPDACTIDRHALVIAGVTRLNVTKNQYQLVKQAYVEVAEENDVLSIEVQQTTWTFYRQQKFSHNSYD